MKVFIQIPHLDDYNKRNRKNYLPVAAGLTFDWTDYDFDLCSSEGIFPKGEKVGKHKFSISLGFMYWSIRVKFYKPKKSWFEEHKEDKVEEIVLNKEPKESLKEYIEGKDFQIIKG